MLPLNHALVLSWSSRHSSFTTRALPAGRRMAQRRPCTRRPELPRGEQGRLGSRRRGECERLQHEGEHSLVAFSTGEDGPSLYEDDYRYGEWRRDWVGGERRT